MFLQPAAGIAFCRRARQCLKRIGWAVEYRNGNGFKDLDPLAPFGDLDQVVGTHDPDESIVRVALSETAQGVDGIACSQIRFRLADVDSTISRNLACRGQTIGIRRHTFNGLQRVLWRDQPPDLIEMEALECQQADVPVTQMRRIEGSAEEAHTWPTGSVACVAGSRIHAPPRGDAAGSDRRRLFKA